jgi:hypothetical protein
MSVYEWLFGKKPQKPSTLAGFMRKKDSQDSRRSGVCLSTGKVSTLEQPLVTNMGESCLHHIRAWTSLAAWANVSHLFVIY